VELPIGRRDICPKCSLDCKVCRNCKFFDKNSYRECVEEQAEWVKEKEVGNFCDYFTPSGADHESNGKMSESDKKLAALFGDPADSKPKSSKLEDEFAAFLKNKK